MAKIGDTSSGFKTRVLKLQAEISKKKKELAKLEVQEVRSRKLWTVGYHAFMRSAEQLALLTVHGTKKEAGLRERIKNWPAETKRMTAERDGFRKQKEEVLVELITLGTKLATLLEQQTNEAKNVDDIVTQVFALNETVVQASTAREECLKRHVFPRLIGVDGNLCSQLSFTSSDGLRRVVAMVNTMTIVHGDLAAQAKLEIQKFFARFQDTTEMHEAVKPLYELTRQLLVEKIDFKVGPDLYRFLAMELDAVVFPELALAQTLLRQSIRSEKTNSYIRIYKRKSPSDPWENVPQS